MGGSCIFAVVLADIALELCAAISLYLSLHSVPLKGEDVQKLIVFYTSLMCIHSRSVF